SEREKLEARGEKQTCIELHRIAAIDTNSFALSPTRHLGDSRSRLGFRSRMTQEPDIWEVQQRIFAVPATHVRRVFRDLRHFRHSRHHALYSQEALVVRTWSDMTQKRQNDATCSPMTQMSTFASCLRRLNSGRHDTNDVNDAKRRVSGPTAQPAA